jgi:protein-L-isoaspartate(D-aspartate) O-methyltransferase
MRRRRRAATTNPLVTATARAGVRDERVLRAVAEVPRAAFVPAEHASGAELDIPLPIPHDLVTTQPSLVARMVEALALTGVERVLEVGAGHGYQTALLARLGDEVWAIERWADLAETARANLARQGIRNAHIVVGDGTLGLAEHAPYDAIVVAAAFPQVPPPLAGQLAAAGRLVQPVGPGGRERVTLFAQTPTGLQRREEVASAHFVRLLGRHGFEDRDT